MNRISFVIFFLLITLLSGMITPVTFSSQGNIAPVFELRDLEGKRVSLNDFKGKVIVLNFWATWCAPCRAEIPSLERLYTGFKNKDFVVIGVSVDNSEKAVKSFVRQVGITFPVLLDSGKEVSFDDYGVVGLPMTFLIDQRGFIIEKIFGERQWDSKEIQEKIKRLLEGR